MAASHRTLQDSEDVSGSMDDAPHASCFFGERELLSLPPSKQVLSSFGFSLSSCCLVHHRKSLIGSLVWTNSLCYCWFPLRLLFELRLPTLRSTLPNCKMPHCVVEAILFASSWFCDELFCWWDHRTHNPL